MDKLAIGLWGCFFGIVVVMVAGSVFAYLRSLRRIALNSAASALASALYVVAHLLGLPFASDKIDATVLAVVTTGVAGVLVYFLFAVLGFLKSRTARKRAIALLAMLLILVLLLSQVLQPEPLLIASTGVAFVLSLLGLVIALRRAVMGDLLAWSVVIATGCLQVALVGLGLIAYDRENTSWTVYAVSGLASTLYMGLMAGVVCARYVYLLELNKVMLQGARYDPVTRMRGQLETGEMVNEVFKSFRESSLKIAPTRPGQKHSAPKHVGVIALTIANLYSLEQLYGTYAVNHALFVCGSRLRRVVPSQVEIGRLGDDGFLLVLPNCTKVAVLVNLAKAVQAALSKPLSVNTRSQIEAAGTVWAADAGVGVLVASHPDAQGADAVSMAYRMAHSAISYASRIAWFDPLSGQTVELPDARLL